jgi:hypothetical protein
MEKPEIFISYSWKDESLKVTEALDQFFQERGITIIRDNRDIGYKGLIKEYMQRLGRGKYVVVVLSDQYFKSKSCMSELMQLAEHQDFYDRIFPVTVEGTGIYEAEDMLKYANYWDEKIEHLQNEIKKAKNIANLPGIHDDLNLYVKIRQNIAPLLGFLRNLNTHSLKGSKFDLLYQAIQARIDQETKELLSDKSKVEKLPPEPPLLRNAYLNWLFEHVSRLSLAGIDRKAASSEAEARLDLGAIYTALLTLDVEREERKFPSREGSGVGSFPSLEEPGMGSERRLSAVAQLNQQKRFVLLGDPGSGKSTFVDFVVMCLAGEQLGDSQANLNLLKAPLPNDEGGDEEEQQPWEYGALLPVRMILRDFAARGLPPTDQPAKAKHLWDFISKELEDATLGHYAPYLQQHLQTEGGLLLLDGLDEVPEADQRRTQIKQAVEDFACAFPNCRVLVTSRTYAYQKQDWRLQGFTETVLAPFTKGQM